jgi:hypothetical protein
MDIFTYPVQYELVGERFKQCVDLLHRKDAKKRLLKIGVFRGD